LKYQKSTTPACKDEFLVLFVFFFYVTYKVSKKAALALVFIPQYEMFSELMFGVKKYQI